jgi:hypothetical protein
VVVVLLLFKLYAGWHWWERVGSGPGVTFSPTGAYVGRYSTLALLVGYLSDVLLTAPIGLNRVWPSWYWHLAYALATALPASLIAVVVYAALTRRFGAGPPLGSPPRCRRCGYILHGLSRPQCPECGEVI